MPAADYANYAKKILRASRLADPTASQAQREAGNAPVGRVHLHGLRVSIEYPAGAVRRGVGKDGKPWSRVVRNAYGYVCGTETKSDGEQLDVWIGGHPASAIGYLVELLTDQGEHDEFKLVIGCRNYAEAKKVITDNYPPDFWDERVGGVRGVLLPEIKKHLKELGVVKERRKEAAAGFMCKKCWTYQRYRTEAEGCPECDKED